MLRINNKVKIELKGRRNWWTLDLLKGLFLALLFHGALFSFFRIETFFDPNQFPIIPPFSVEIDLSKTAPQKEIQEPLFVFPIVVETMPTSLDLPIGLDTDCAFSPTTYIFDFSQFEKLEHVSSLEKEEDL